MEINIKKVTRFDLNIYSEQELIELSTLVGIDSQSLLYNKKNGVKTIFLLVDELVEVASIIREGSPFSKTYTTYNGLITEFPLSRRQIKHLLQLKPFDFRSFKKHQNQESRKESANKLSEETTVNLDLDTILDKISSLGIESLSKKEKEFLNNLSN